MSAPCITPNPHPPGGSPAELRQEIAEMMGALEVRAGIIRSYAELGDDAGLAYGLRVITAELKAALGAAGMLAQVTEPERARRRAARTSQPEAREVAL